MVVSIFLNMSMSMYSKKFKHNKTGNIYEVLREDVINCTNANSEQTMVLYQNPDIKDKIFVREKVEFYEKFTLLE